MDRIHEGITSPDKTFLLYIVSVIMYCVSFYYLFKNHLPSENIIFMFVFVLNTIFPFIWIKDFLSIDAENESAHRLIIYRNFGVVAAISVQFLSLFMVALKNENVRKMKILSITKDDETHNRQTQKNLNTNDEGTEKADKNIAILFVTITTLLWGIVGMAFSENNVFKITDSTDYSPFFQTIRWLLNQPYQIINNVETTWLHFMDRIDVSPLVKAFSIYWLTFLVTFFGVFVRINQPHKQNSMDLFKIVNIFPLFPAVFNRHLDKYRSIGVFFLSFIVSLCFAGIMFTFNSFYRILSNSTFIGASAVSFSVILSWLFWKRKELFPNKNSVKHLIYYLLCVIFALVGTPVVLAALQLLVGTGLLSIVQKICSNLFAHPPPVLSTLNYNGILEGSAVVIFTVLMFAMYAIGVDKKWLSSANDKSIQMFLVTLVTMTISLFTALNTKYRVSLGLYEWIKAILQFLLVYVAPLLLTVLAIVQFIFSYTNYMKYKQFEKLS